MPIAIGTYGNQFSILIALVALYLTGRLPSILDREMEMEDLELEFDEEQVKETVDAFLEAEDFESIRSQIDIIGATSEELSDEDMKDILGEDVPRILSLKEVKGIGSVLEKKLTDMCFWPQFMTQLAIVIYVTDLNDSHFKKKIKQTNLRALSGCSAYAFHRTRNKLGLK